MAVKVYQFYASAPPAGKVMFIGAGVALAVVAYIAIAKTIKNINRKKDLRGQIKAAQDATAAVNTYKSQGVNLSYPEAQYSAWASAIHNAFGGCDPSSDDMGAVANAMNQMKNDADVYKLISVFGVRKWDECGWWRGDVESDLVGGVRHELDQTDINIINNILSGKNISFRF